MLRFQLCVIFLAVAWKFVPIVWYGNIALASLLYLVSGGWKWLWIVSKTFKRDVSHFLNYRKSADWVRRMVKKEKTISDLFSEVVKKNSNKIAYTSADSGESLTFQEAEDLALKIANIFYSAGYRKGDVIALMMENRIEYVPIWLGLSMIGVTTSLINVNIRLNGLKHCLEISKNKAIIFSEEMIDSIQEIQDDLDVELYCLEECQSDIRKVKSLVRLLESTVALRPPRPPQLTLNHPLLYMYTSGTTGLPKAVIMRATKLLTLVTLCHLVVGVIHNDIIYNALPFFHVNGGMLSTCTLVHGCTTVVKKKFSASRYMEDCFLHKVTVMNYIGEICRYLLKQPPRKFDKMNDIRIAVGNGLKSSIWQEFQDKFRIGKIVEIYGSTEGNAGLINTVGKTGSIGYLYVSIPFLNNKRIIKVDGKTGDIIRNRYGLAIEAKPGEPGQIVGMIRTNTAVQYDGYLDKAATEKKIARNIFVKGDAAFLSGDIVVKDEEGFVYFLDRTGDSFRWRSENVSTNEVEGVISKAVDMVDVAVYGVEVPGEEGKAGMACINDPDRKINIDVLQESLQKALPKYAVPVFLRLTSKIDMTGTFKVRKSKLKKESYNPDDCANDDVYYMNSDEKKYVPLDRNIYEQILNQCVRF